MSEAQAETRPLLRHEDVEATEVFPIIHLIRSDIIHFIDTPLTYEALTAPDITYTLVQPLVEKYLSIQRSGNMAVVFCLLLNRVQFIRDDNPLTATVSRSRALLCELLATRVFRDYGGSTMHLALALTTTWPVYNGADANVINRAREERDDDLEERVGNAIEMAILGKAKRFIKSSQCQRVINAIWSGKCVYQAQSSHSILSDTYKRTPIHFYDPHKAPLLDHYRLKVPAIRSVLEYMNFLILFILFICAIEVDKYHYRIDPIEILFMVYALGFTLEKVAAMQEHGIKVYFKGTWNGFDLAFITMYAAYAILRLYGIHYHARWAGDTAIDSLALIACLLFPRLAFVTLKDNLMVLSLRAMIVQFAALMFIAVWCFCGFLYALWTLSRNEAKYGAGQIAWWMLDLWFGLDASGFDRATEFHPIFGPVLMVTYACLSNTLLLTVLVSILSNTFATINEDAAAEAMFRKAVLTIEGVKADFLFSYQPPVNLLAVCIMLPASYILSPRWFHKFNVFMIRLTSFPLLLMISLYERQSKKSGTMGFYETLSSVTDSIVDTLPRGLKRMTFFEGLAGSYGDISAIFEIEDEFESALDTGEEDTPYPFPQPRARRSSQFSNGQPAQPQRQQSEAPPRLRVNSVFQRGLTDQNYGASPLAQVFQPLVVDIPEEGPSENDKPPPTPASPIVSYGPASRRRLSSMVSLHQPEALRPHQAQAHSTALKKFPSLSPQPEHPPNQHFLSPLARSSSGQQPSPPPFTGSPGSVGSQTSLPSPGRRNRAPLVGSPEQDSNIKTPPTAAELEDMEEEHPEQLQSDTDRRLEEMEKRQKRIEQLLEKVVEGLGKR